MYTFSQLVDELVAETKRPDLVSDISRYLNQTIREVHFTEDRNAILYFAENFREQLLIANSESGFTWDAPDPTIFQRMQGIKYLNQWDDDGNEIWARETTPGRHLRDLTHFYYRAGNTFVFAGYGGLNSQIAAAWYEFPRSLKYKSVANRPAQYDVETGWTYDPAITTPEEELGARELTTNWLILRWNQVIAEGLRAKVYKRLSDDTRARTSYSLYSSLRHGLWTSETAEFYGG